MFRKNFVMQQDLEPHKIDAAPLHKYYVFCGEYWFFKYFINLSFAKKILWEQN
jgi:hypothetical protein